ncbi:hypothetical protein EIP86_002968 [Pleurotus ostreatoroseus]|nr:hypothetical protein EIP86_002968 [Pleurotus ostreatoroseus]
MASGTSPSTKRNSFQRLSNIFGLTSPSFARLSFDANAATDRRKASGTTPRSYALNSDSSALPPHEAEVAGHGNNAAPSILSTADSSLSSPLSPLLPATPISLSVADLPVPPTSNDLAAGEKAMLMRKMRKLSQVLGEVPVPRVVDEEDPDASTRNRLSAVLEDDGRSGLSSPRMGSIAESAKSAKKAFRKSFTMGTTTNRTSIEWQKHVPRVKSLSSLRPSLKIASPSRRSLDEPSSPIIFAWPDGERPGETPYPSAPSSPRPDHSRSDSEPPSAFHKFLQRRDSTASSVLLADQNPEQLQRARVAKLSRYLGEAVPPDVLRRAASPPPPRAASPAPSSEHTAATLEKLSAPSSMRIRTPSPRPRRPLSLDFRSLRSSGTNSAPSTPPAHVASHFNTPTSGVRRTRSLWSKGASSHSEEASEGSHDDLIGESEPMSEKQRMRNVRRARKMAQLFGDNPPSALFQITSLSGGSSLNVTVDDASDHDGHGWRHRDSLTTIISISTTSLAQSQNGSTTRRLRDSYISMVTTSSEMSALILTEHDEPEVEEKRPSLERSRSFSAPEKPPPPPGTPIRPSLSTAPSEPNLKHKAKRPRTADSSASTNRPPPLLPIPTAVIHQPPRTPPTPPPFADLLPASGSWPIAPPAPPPTLEDFQARRRRAAKLSRFFGVEVKQLAEVLPPDIPTPAVPAKAVLAQEQAVIPEAIQRPSRRPSTTVSEAKNRRRFLSSNENDDVKEVDMIEVMDQLRRMKNR